jgi:HlyD family secretion protein
MKTRNIIIISIIVLIVAGIAAKKAGWIGKSTKLEVATEQAKNRTIVETVSTNGKIQPEVEVKISADVSGEIVELHVKEGQKVLKGEHLLTINPDLIKAAADRVAAALNQTKANLANAKARQLQVEATFANIELTFNRTKKLYDKKAVSDAEYDNANAQYLGAKADLEAAKQTVIASEFSVKSAEASLKEANDNLSRTRIYAPSDGTVSKMNVELGERVVGTAQMSGTELLRIANLNEMEVNVQVNENDIVRVSLNDTAIVEVEAYKKRQFKGLITSIARSSTSSALAQASSDQVVNFEVKIRILRESYQDLVNPETPYISPFFPGMTATVDIRTNVVKNVLSIPIMSVTTRSKKDEDKKDAPKIENDMEVIEAEELKELVFVYQDGKVKQVEVVTGIQDKDYIQILKGLTANQEVVSAPYSAISKALKNDMEVEKVDIEKLNQRTDTK